MPETNRFFDFAEAMQSTDCPYEAWRLLNVEIERLGFTGATYGLSSGLRSGSISQEVKYFSSYNSDFAQAYVDDELADHDYVVQHCAKRGTPTFWSAIEDRYPTERSRMFHECANDFGLREGVVIPFHDPSSTVVSGIGLSFDHALKGDDVRCAVQNWDALIKICNLFDTFMRQPKALRETYNLSAREIECVRLVCFGKVHKEIAFDLNLSPKTVEHYLANAGRKLNCRNKHHLAAKAALLGVAMT